MRKKKKFVIPVAAGFIVLYMVVMAASTWLVEQKYLEEFRLYYNNKMVESNDIYQSIESQIQAGSMYAQERELWRNLNPYLLNAWRYEKYQQFSAAFYDEETGKSYIIRDRLANGQWRSHGDEGQMNFVYSLADFLTDDEIEALAGYQLEVYQDKEPTEPYRFYGLFSKHTGELCGILVQKVIWEKNGDSEGKKDSIRGSISSQSQTDDNGHTDNYVQIDDEIVWEWYNPEMAGIGDSETSIAKMRSELSYLYQGYDENLGIMEMNFTFPYLYWGYDKWQQWENSDYLQSAMRDVDWEEEIDLGNLPEWSTKYSNIYTIYSDVDNHLIGRFMLASECHPWLAAMDYMKYVYLGGFLLMAVCMGVVIRLTSKTYAQREALDEARRDFTNAMAHEMKTPLGIIRGLAENLQENTVEEKRDYYLAQIVGQTEEMNGLVAEMIDVSKLDSEHLVLQRDTLSLNELIKEQIPKFQPVIDGKQLQIQLEERADFEIIGDKKYISKAIGNLLDNAVCYCNKNSVIRIIIDTGTCSIENDCEPIAEEKLSHIFEMFYQGNQGRHSSERHLGIGLFLTRKIFRLHHMHIVMENTQTGVIVKIKK